MRALPHLFEQNRRWAEETETRDPGFFRSLVDQQAPEYLWIGCSDSRIPPNEIVGLRPGELFVHRNVANVVAQNDLNCLSVLQYAVEVLRVKHVIVCGHYRCGGVLAALRGEPLGLIDNWLRAVRDLRDRHRALLAEDTDEAVRGDRLCEINVAEQARNVCRTTVVEAAWARGQSLSVHGWIYGLHDGRLRDLGVCITGPADLSD